MGAKEKIYVLNFQNDNIVATLAKNILEAMKKLGAVAPLPPHPHISVGSTLAYVSMPDEPPRWYKRLRGESRDDHRYRWQGLINVVKLNGCRKLWTLEEVPQNVSGKNIEG